METTKKGVKSITDVILVSLLLTLNGFHTVLLLLLLTLKNKCRLAYTRKTIIYTIFEYSHNVSY